jgi:hypothetical protein
MTLREAFEAFIETKAYKHILPIASMIIAPYTLFYILSAIR